MNRRNFLFTVLRGAACASATGFVPVNWAQSLLASGPSWIMLNGRGAGWATARHGDTIISRNPVDRGPGGQLPRPSAPTKTITDMQLEFASGMSPAFYRWIGECLRATRAEPTNLETVRFTPSGKSYARRWTGAYVTALRIPELDAARHDPIQLQADIQLGTSVDMPHVPHHRPHSPVPIWRRSEFRFHIDGLNVADWPVAGISSLSFQRPLATNVLNSHHRNSVEAGAPVLSDLTLRLMAPSRPQFLREFNRLRPQRAVLELMSVTTDPWLRFEFCGLAMRPISLQQSDAKVQLSCTSARLDFPLSFPEPLLPALK